MGSEKKNKKYHSLEKKKINMHVVKQNEGGCVLEEKKREDKHMN